MPGRHAEQAHRNGHREFGAAFEARHRGGNETGKPVGNVTLADRERAGEVRRRAMHPCDEAALRRGAGVHRIE